MVGAVAEPTVEVVGAAAESTVEDSVVSMGAAASLGAGLLEAVGASGVAAGTGAAAVTWSTAAGTLGAGTVEVSITSAYAAGTNRISGRTTSARTTRRERCGSWWWRLLSILLPCSRFE